MRRSPEGNNPDVNDDRIARWGRSRNEGYKKFKHGFMQPAPILFTQDHHPLWIGDIYRGRSVFLICGGPSFAKLDHSKLRQAGIVTMGVNNSPRTFRPNLWTSVDSPTNWIRSTWLDPTIMKFVPIDHASKKIFNSDKWAMMDIKVGDCPNVVYYKRNEKFIAKQYLFEDCINWGNHKKYGGGRSIMLAAIRILFILGFRKVYLLGCDFKMDQNTKYHFDQDRATGSIKGNNSTYQKLNERFKELRPYFAKEDFHVFNCNPDSGLKAFDFVKFDDAIDESLSHMDYVDLENERTHGLYDTDLREKEEGVGKEPTWFRAQVGVKLKKCKYCGKHCAKASGDKSKPGKIRIIATCEKIREKLWNKRRGRYHGNHDDIGTPWLTEREAAENWDKRFGTIDKK